MVIQVCADPDCSMEGDLPMIQCMGPGCSSQVSISIKIDLRADQTTLQYHRCCAGIHETAEDAVDEWFCDADCRVNAGRGRKRARRN